MSLGHNFIGHHHHDKEHLAFDHSHADDHHHENENNDDEENDFDFLHFLSLLPHDGDVVTFLKSQELAKLKYKQLLSSSAIFQPTLGILLDLERQNAPPFIAIYFNSQHYLPSGLRAPPVFIV